MAHWISSKLKAAESLLQQIDHQAAESLGKNEKLPSNDQLGVEKSPRTPETRSLIKEQLKKKAPEYVVNCGIISGDRQKLSGSSRSNNIINQDDQVVGSLNLHSKSDLSSEEGDWTELLSIPDKKGTLRSGSQSGSTNRVSGIRALKKDVNKVGNFVLGLNLSLVDGKKENVQDNGVLKSPKKVQVGLEDNNTSIRRDEKASNLGHATTRISSVQTPRSACELDRMDKELPFVHDNMAEKLKIGEMKETVNDKKPLPSTESNQSYYMIPISCERDLNTMVGLNDGEVFKRGLSRSNRSITESRIPSSTKKVSSLPSDGESNSETDASSTSSDSEIEREREREERRKQRQQLLVEKAAAKAVEAIKEQENLVARLEGEKQSLEKIFEERARQQVQEASELQTTMMATMESVELEKQKHDNTCMEALARLLKLESVTVEFTRLLANAQKNLEVEVDRVAELRQQFHMKEATHEELRRKLSSMHQNREKLQASSGVELELEMLEAEHSFINDKVGRMQDRAKTFETSIETTLREIESPSEVELELKQRLRQLTDHLIQKQAQVETLSSENATLLFRMEAVSRLLDENKAPINSTDLTGTASRDDPESGVWQTSGSKIGPSLKQTMQSGKQQLGSLILQFDALFYVGAMFLKQNSTARVWSLIYLICIHLWAMYIIMSHPPASDGSPTGAIFSLENINNTGGV